MNNITTVEEFNSLRNIQGINYTVDDFMSDYRVSKRLADTLLKDMEHIMISQSLFNKIDDIDRKKFFNKDDVFQALLKSGKLSYNLRFFARTGLGTREKQTEVTSEVIPVVYVINHVELFRDILIKAVKPKNIKSIADGSLRNMNRRYNRLQGIEILIGETRDKQVRRFYQLKKNDKRYHEIQKMIHIPPNLLMKYDK